MEFTKGIKDGLPIALGYVPVAFAYAVGAVDRGFPLWFPILISASNFTGTGQFAGTNLIAAGASLAVLFATMLVINIRYALMSLSLSQKMEGFPLWQRAVIAFGVTDENFAVAIRRPQKLTFPYLMGLMSCSFCGWVGGTVLGAALAAILSSLLTGSAAAYYQLAMSAFNIALYAMFVAIVIPAAREERSVLLLVALSVAASCVFYFVPALQALPDGLEIVICSIVCTVAVSLLFPRKEEGTDKQEETPGAEKAEGAPGAEKAEEAKGEPGAEKAEGAPGAEKAEGAPGAEKAEKAKGEPGAEGGKQ